MVRNITHVLETTELQAGQVYSALQGLFDFQKRKGWGVRVVSRENIAEAGESVEEADLIHMHGTVGETIRHVSMLLKSSQKRYVVSTYAGQMHGPLRYGGLSRNPSRPAGWRRVREWWNELTYRNGLLKNAWCLHALSASEADILKRRRSKARVKVLPMGIGVGSKVGEAPGSDIRRWEGKRVILFLGRLHPAEGLIPLLKGCALIADRSLNLHLVLAGEEHAHWTKVLEAGIRRQGFSDRVTLIASPDTYQVEELLAEASLLVAPNPSECCPVGPLQALAAGKPVIISPGCSLPEVVMRNAGWVVEPKRKKLQQALQEAFSLSRSELEKMGRRGAGIIKDRYTWERLGHEYLNLYARVME